MDFGSTSFLKAVNRQLLLVAFSFCWVTVPANVVYGQNQVSVKERFTVKGEVQSVQPGEITIRNSATGETQAFKIQDKDEKVISLEGGKVIFRAPAKIKVAGSLPIKLIEPGMIVEFNTPINRRGKSDAAIKTLNVIQGDASDLTIDPESKPTGKDYVPAKVVGLVKDIRKDKVQLEIPDSRYASGSRAYFKLDPEAELVINQDSLNLVIPGDTVNQLRAVKLTNGALVAAEIDISLTADRDKATQSFNDQLEQKFSAMSDEPGQPRELSSDHFILYTDVSDRSAAVLLSKLERMYGLIAQYFGKRPRKAIECYVVRRENLNAWVDKIPPSGAAKIAEGAGVTASRSIGRITNSTVYSCSDHGVVQHESVHAFCAMSFGSAGPVWYAEGMAEMGQYWQQGQLEVSVTPVVIDYLTHANQPKKMRDIVAAGQITGDSWKAYAWRWALCHLLANNPNYATRFKQLGITLMAKGPDSFDNAFGSIAPLISFEYDQFVQNFGNGYRVDLCVWDWKSKPKKLSSKGKTQVEVLAQAGWQATKVEVFQGESYDFAAQGKWKTDSKTETDADGSKTGTGRLQAAIFNDFQLSEPFDLGKRGSFTASTDGHLYVRCSDDWTDLSNNDGQLTVFLRKTAKDNSASKN